MRCEFNIVTFKIKVFRDEIPVFYIDTHMGVNGKGQTGPYLIR